MSSAIIVQDENSQVGGPSTRNQKSFASQGAPKERRALGVISGNVQQNADKPAKRTSQRRATTAAAKPKPTSFEVEQDQSEQVAVEQLCGSVSEIKFDDVVDVRSRNDAQEVADYIDDILRMYRKTETKGLPPAGYMSMQTDINEKMREILIDWIIEVHMKFTLVPVTLYMTVQIIDRFLSKKQVSRSKLQLVGITAMHIASKFEEIYPPEVRDFVYISDKAYTGDEIIKMERAILNTLKFEIVFPTVHSFGKQFSKVAALDESTEHVAFYLIDKTLHDYSMLKYKPSIIAAAGVNLAERISKRVTVATAVWSADVAEYIGFTEAELEPCMRDMHAYLSKEDTLKAVTKKYSNEKYGAVAKSLTPLTAM